MVIVVFVIADSENQVWYKTVIKALSDILEEGTDHPYSVLTFRCWQRHHTIKFTEN